MRYSQFAAPVAEKLHRIIQGVHVLIHICCRGRGKAASFQTAGYLKIWKRRYLVSVVYSFFYIGAIFFINIVQDCYTHPYFVSVQMKHGQRICRSVVGVAAVRDIRTLLIDSKVKVRIELL